MDMLFVLIQMPAFALSASKTQTEQKNLKFSFCTPGLLLFDIPKITNISFYKAGKVYKRVEGQLVIVV